MKNFNSLFNAFVNDVLENVFAESPYDFDEQATTNRYSNEDLLHNKEIYLDTSSFMCEEADRFFLKVIPLLEQYGTPINTLSCCIREINKHLNSDDYDKYHKALNAKERIEKLIDAGLLNIIDYSSDTFADADFLAYFSKRRIHTEILFISQDGNLSVDVHKLNESRSVSGHDIVVKKIDVNGNLATNHLLEEYLDDDASVTDNDFADEVYHYKTLRNHNDVITIRNHEVFTDDLFGSSHNFWLSIH